MKNKTIINGQRLIHDKLILNMSMGLPRTQAEGAEAACLLRTLDAAARAATLTVAGAFFSAALLRFRRTVALS